MKKSVLILGIALVLFSNISYAKSTIELPSNLSQNLSFSVNTIKMILNDGIKFKKPDLAQDFEVINQAKQIDSNLKYIKEAIAEGDRIVENTVSDDKEFIEYEEEMRKIVVQSDLIIQSNISDIIYPLFVERTIYDEVAELELIIESTETNEIRFLDFKKINSNSTIVNRFNTKAFIGMN